MKNQEMIIREFFGKYEEQFYLGLSGKIDAEEAASSFADCYASASGLLPQG